MYDEQTYVAARAAMRRAVEHAAAVAVRRGWPIGDGRWNDEADDALYDMRAELDNAVYQLALELLAEEGRRWLELSNRSGGC